MIALVKHIVVAFSLLSICLGAYAQNTKVVVIPMFGENPPLEPFAPLTSSSPPISSYSDTGESIIDKITGLEWQQKRI